MARIPMLLCACALAGVAAVAGAAPCDRLDTASWLLGEWIASDPGRVVTESWRAAGPDTFEGSGVTRSTSDGRIIESESLRLVRMADAVFYVAKVPHNAYPVSFQLVECLPHRLVFANPSHDFPRRLEYTLAEDGTLAVSVSDGADKVFTLRFRAAEDTRP